MDDSNWTPLFPAGLYLLVLLAGQVAAGVSSRLYLQPSTHNVWDMGAPAGEGQSWLLPHGLGSPEQGRAGSRAPPLPLLQNAGPWFPKNPEVKPWLCQRLHFSPYISPCTLTAALLPQDCAAQCNSWELGRKHYSARGPGRGWAQPPRRPAPPCGFVMPSPVWKPFPWKSSLPTQTQCLSLLVSPPLPPPEKLCFKWSFETREKGWAWHRLRLFLPFCERHGDRRLLGFLRRTDRQW